MHIVQLPIFDVSVLMELSCSPMENAVSILRHELMAAESGLGLAKIIRHTLELLSVNWTLWSDSMDVLYWIRGCSPNFKPFVPKRVGEIQNSTYPIQWRNVPNENKPADLVSRGTAVIKLTDENIWWNDLTFLCTSTDEWPKNKVEDRLAPDHEMRKENQKVVTM
ncbi:hypothetical protein LSH36_128g01015 [Paralvinella palmiformis]|uniref:Uncharacterized protein n=1 Tax=Paralvinella palmiformis TaxID=53620 RepID=A0AAD9JWZ2_9ANNE|nr:hypothetical protein LSH36_128g01015 [Paralvinella palmiformis]